MIPGLSHAEVATAAIPFRLDLLRDFRGVRFREGVLIEGPSGWGEFAPFDDYSDERAARWLASALEAAYGTWPIAKRTAVAVNAIIPQTNFDDTMLMVQSALNEQGCTTIKIKVGEVREENERVVAAVRSAMTTALGSGIGSIRLDVNGGWSVREAVEQLRMLAPYGIEYVEQPCAEIADLRELRGHDLVPIAVDESIRLAADPAAVRVADFADVAVLKPTTLGGVHRTLEIAESLRVSVVISGSLDSSIGLSVGLAAAAALPGSPTASGLGTGVLLTNDVIASPALPEGGSITSERHIPDPELLADAAARVSPERTLWWHGRLAAAWSHLT